MEIKYEFKKFCPSNCVLLHWFADHFFPDFALADNATDVVGTKCLLVFFAAIVTKRPEFSSSFLIAIIFLIEVFLMRLLGLMSSMTVLGFYF